MSASPRSLVIPIFLLLLTSVAISTAVAEPATHRGAPEFALLTFTPPSSNSGGSAVPVANWTFSGCWSPRTGAPCVDVYRDSSGQAWACKACGQTGNPSPGKCQKVSQAQLDAGRWCS